MKNRSRWLKHPIDSSLAKVGGKRKSVIMDKDSPFNHVLKVYQETRRPRGSYLSAKYLDALNIRVFEMDLETGKPEDPGLQFGTPYPSQEVDKLFEEVSDDFGGLDQGDLFCTGCGIATTIKNSFDEMGLFGLGVEPKPIGAYYAREKKRYSTVEDRLGFYGSSRDKEPDFHTRLIFEAYDKRIPHRGCILLDGAVSDERFLRRSEVYCAALLIGDKLRWTKKPHERHFPVFIYSVSGSQGRIIQAHYEHPHFIVRKTKHFLFEEGSASGYKMMVRWMLNNPTGDIETPRKSTKDRVLNLVKTLKPSVH
ncbi:uncharacterized protein Z518_05617 [Rhinocladiella mackenziei CBS 650.93]|uniref:Rhinocladiella mackenziei CBS 650.93 unplaced genomic scaffold supercont1.4, whole genome shotgun sequence n=1 Tax=Rhinocladiella mackenziei CBS 650.93 TaxID=1442369 RepID=A0A0D2FRC2_9EURO|nr:uncharacterized protein Z518_05617 [Rhinocladiella mackenziei CBS 650.93]KIX04747.1 hypothetical protein Z518_05617 [Rhinocladiella mackenziei CBS 650.93]